MKKCFMVIVVLLYSFICINMVIAADGTWTQKADFGGGDRALAVGFSIGNKGYTGTGGNTTLGTGFKDFWEYDPAANTWTQKADVGGAERGAAVGFSIGNKGYVGTGMGVDNILYKDFWEYNQTTNTWTQKADFGGTPRWLAAGFSIGSKGYVGMGLAQNTEYNSAENCYDFWEYAPDTNIWTQKTEPGGSVGGISYGFAIGNKGYVSTTGGVGGDCTTSKNNLWEYNQTTNTWTRKADFEWPVRVSGAGFVTGSKFYMTGGCCETDSYKDFWEYDPATEISTRKADFGGEARIDAVGFSIGTKGYIGTGMFGNWNYWGPSTKDFWEYEPPSSLPNKDFNGDGISDIIWKNGSTDRLWYMRDIGAPSAYMHLFTNPDMKVVGTGDINGDGISDIIARIGSTGQVGLWFMYANGTRSSYKTILTDSNWTVVGTGDFNGDGISDIIARKDSTGQVDLWFMNADGTRSSYRTILTDLNYTVVGQ